MKRISVLQRIILFKLMEKDMYGYLLRKEIAELAEERRFPSFGSLYPALKSLEKEKLITSKRSGRKIIYKITPTGKKLLKREIKEGMKDFINKLPIYEKLYANDPFILPFKIAWKFNMAKKSDAIRILEECLSKLEEIS